MPVRLGAAHTLPLGGEPEGQSVRRYERQGEDALCASFLGAEIETKGSIYGCVFDPAAGEDACPPLTYTYVHDPAAGEDARPPLTYTYVHDPASVAGGAVGGPGGDESENAMAISDVSLGDSLRFGPLHDVEPAAARTGANREHQGAVLDSAWDDRPTAAEGGALGHDMQWASIPGHRHSHCARSLEERLAHSAALDAA